MTLITVIIVIGLVIAVIFFIAGMIAGNEDYTVGAVVGLVIAMAGCVGGIASLDATQRLVHERLVQMIGPEAANASQVKQNTWQVTKDGTGYLFVCPSEDISACTLWVPAP